VETYSTGMRQKLRFAQAIVHDPPVLVLDEPTSGLDPKERESMLNRIKLLARDHGKAVLLCTHILPDVQTISDAVVILARGRVQVADRLQELSRPTKPSLQVQLTGETAGFVSQLREQGFNVETTRNGTLVIEGPQHELADQVWRIARESGVGVRSLAPSRNSLDEIFLAAVQEQPDGNA
jgi:ABC-2 type transport system ATP-binding protein